MPSTTELRVAWAGWKWDTSKMVRVSFPGVGRDWDLLVADLSAPAWRIFASIMAEEDYLFRETAGGTYNPRPIAGTTLASLHGYGLALDLNPSKNPRGLPLRTDLPDRFRARIASIECDGLRVFEWGGAWDYPDPMHFEVDRTPAELRGRLTYHQTEQEDTDKMLPITVGSPVEDVRALQQLLSVSFSLEIAETGIYDAPTKAAVKTYLGNSTNSVQGAAGEFVNGRMWVALLGAHVQRIAGSSSSRGLTEEQVRAIVDGAPIVGRVDLP